MSVSAIFGQESVVNPIRPISDGGCGEVNNGKSKESYETLPKDSKMSDIMETQDSEASAYTLADDRSQFSRDVDRWLGINRVSTENAAVQPSRVPVVQRSVLARSSSLGQSGIWYAMAMMLPLFSINSCPHWRCTTGVMVHAGEKLFDHMVRACGRARRCIRTLAQDHVVRELFATAMDIVLIIYAIGFLVLSMYQASIFG